MIREITIETKEKEAVIDITSQVKEIVKNSQVTNGLCVVYVRHATAAIIINENADEGFRQDILTALDAIIPRHNGWKHDLVDTNAHAHLKSSLLGVSESIPIVENELQLGTWQGITLIEFDGPRQRKIIIQVIEDKK